MELICSTTSSPRRELMHSALYNGTISTDNLYTAVGTIQYVTVTGHVSTCRSFPRGVPRSLSHARCELLALSAGSSSFMGNSSESSWTFQGFPVLSRVFWILLECSRMIQQSLANASSFRLVLGIARSFIDPCQPLVFCWPHIISSTMI